MEVRLDIWHFMRRMAKGCTSESHPLYGTFLGRLSSCIYEWDEPDYLLLMAAKRGELVQAGVPCPSESAIKKAITKEEMARHCRRTTRGTETTTREIESLLLALSAATDALGVPLLREEMTPIWEEQRHHIPCLQDPPNVCLYTITGHITKGGVELPVLRCARGSTSLESFHLHLARFIPGSAAGPTNYQAYLLDGITRWNSSRATAAIQSPTETLRTFDARLQEKVSHVKYTHPVISKLNCHICHYTGECPQPVRTWQQGLPQLPAFSCVHGRTLWGGVLKLPDRGTILHQGGGGLGQGDRRGVYRCGRTGHRLVYICTTIFIIYMRDK